jgi:hypothetical protein
MARGWESKAVEAQQADAAAARPSAPALSADETARRSRVLTLRLARARAAADLHAATAPHHRTMLERAIADLDRQIEAVGAEDRHRQG